MCPRELHFWLPPAHLSTTHSGGFTLSLLKLNVKQESCEYQLLYSLWFDPTGNRTRGTASVADALSTRPLIGFEYLESETGKNTVLYSRPNTNTHNLPTDCSDELPNHI